MNRLLLAISLILIVVIPSVAQKNTYTITNKKAIELYQKALEAYDKYDLESSTKLLEESINKEPKFIEAYLMLTQAYNEQNLVDKAIDAANKAIAINPDFYPYVHLNLGKLYLYIGEYQKAKESFERFIGYKTVKNDLVKVAERDLLCCNFALQSLQNPVPFNPISLGINVNTKLEEYWPSISADENTLVITVNLPIDSTSDQVFHNRQEDFYITHRDKDGNWEKPVSLGKPINTPFNEGAQSITSDGKKMYYTVCRGVCNIFSSELKSDGTWSTPTRLSTINSNRFSNKQPSISPDGRTLYFVSNRPGGYGGYDIWKSTLKETGIWSEPKNLGDSINTPGDEQSPFIHFDNQTLYFASNGLIGMGGLDLYVSKQQPDSSWTKPKNLGYPINTYRDEDGLIVNAKGTTAYYSSAKNLETGRDIYSFRLYTEIQPTPSSYLCGTITESRSGFPLQANFNLIDLSNGKEIMKSKSSEDGSFLVCIPTEKSYALYASAPGYLFYSDHFDMKGEHSIDKPFKKNIILDPIKVNQVMIMRNIFYETDAYELKPESKVELNRLVDFLKANSTLKIEIGGHTDNQGNDAYNQTLSEKRAKSVVDYLIANQIAPERLKWAGYGRLKPISDNKTDEGRAQNRRTEVKIIGM